MFKYKFYEFFNKEINVLTFQLEQTKLLIGGFFNESSLINIIKEYKTKILINEDYLKINWGLFPFMIDINNNENILKLKEIFEDLKLIIIPNFEYMLSYTLIFKILKANKNIFETTEDILNNIIIYATEPIIQFSLSYLTEFYKAFNKMILDLSNKYINKIKVITVTENDINYIMKKTVKISYNEKINYLVTLTSNLNDLCQSNYFIEKNINFEISSNGYNLGSGNILIHFYNKKILILTNSSLYTYRYPKSFDFERQHNPDYLIRFPDIINKDTNYEKNFEIVYNLIYKLSNVSFNKNNLHMYPYSLILCDIFFMMDFCDVFRLKLNKTMQSVYFSSSINSLLKFANINLGYLNSNLNNKVFGFELPFSYDEIIKENRLILYKDLSEFKNELIEYNKANNDNLNIKNFKNEQKGQIFLNNLINQNNTFCFITHYFDFFSKLDSENSILEFFLNNYEPNYDIIILLSNYNHFDFLNYIEQINSTACKNSVKKLNIDNFILDYRLTEVQYNTLIQKISPFKILPYEISNEFYDINIVDDVFYENSFLLSQKKSGILNEINDLDKIKAKFDFEQLRYNIQLISNKENKKIENYNLSEKLEKTIQNYLEGNNMEISEFLSKENSVYLIIFNKIKKTFSEINLIDINLDISTITEVNHEANNSFPKIHINSEDAEDTYFLNSLFAKIFNL